MTIDEAIQDFRQLENEFEHYMCDTEDKKENLVKYQREWEYYKQLAEWLEELKNIREENAYLHCEMQAIGATIDMLEEEIRNRAIDDYVERLKETYKPCKEADNYIYTVVCRRFDDIAQQLKAGDDDA